MTDEIGTTGTEQEIIDREAQAAQDRWPVGARVREGWIAAVEPLVRVILAFVAAMGAKSVREALARAQALLAPVDVEAKVERLVTEALRLGATSAAAVHQAVRPLVEDRARLAREVERLTGECDAWHRAANNRAAYAEKIGLPYPPIAELDAARAEIESLTRGVSHHMTVAAIHRAEIARLTAELAERTTERDRLNRWWCDVRKMFGEDTKKINRYAAALEATDGSMSCDEEREAGQYLRMLCYALAAVDEPSRSRTAAPGEAWERLSTLRAAGWTVAVHNDYRLNGEPHTFWLFTREGRAIKGEGRTDAEALTTCCALAAVEPRADTIAVDPSAPVDSRDALAAAETEIRRIYRAHPLDTWIPVLARRMAAPVIDVTAITHDYRPGAQDGMPRCPDLYVDPGGCEACGNATGERHAWRCEGAAEPLTPAETREIIASAPGQSEPRDEVTDTELADLLEQIEDAGVHGWTLPDGQSAMIKAPGGHLSVLHTSQLRAWAGILRRLARAEQTRRAAPVDRESLGRLVRDVWITWAREQTSPKPSWIVPWEGLSEPDREVDRRIGETVARVAIGARPAATPPRALTEAEARAVYDAAIDAWLADEADARPQREVIVSAIVAASRGDVPPEARPRALCVRCPVCPYFATGGMRRAGDSCPNDDGGILVVDARVTKAAAREEVRAEMAVQDPDDAPDSVDPADLCPGCFTGGDDPHTRTERCSGARAERPEDGPPPDYWDAGVAIERQAPAERLLDWARQPAPSLAGTLGRTALDGPARARPRVGAWVAWEPACGASIYDDHGQVVASVWEAPDGWRWSANRQHLAPVQGGPVPHEDARAAALNVLATWCDVSAARAVSGGHNAAEC